MYYDYDISPSKNESDPLATNFEKTGNILLDELITETPYDELEDTLELDTLILDAEEAYVLEDKIEKEKPKKEKFLNLKMTTAEDHHLEYAFVSCAIAGFITAFIAIGIVFLIMKMI